MDFFSLPEEKKAEIVKLFWTRVDKNGPNECWLWFGDMHVTGYGRLWVKGLNKRMLAHKLSWMINYNAPIPNELNICHSCDVRNCIRPSHLFMATSQQNIQDMVMKDRRCAVKLPIRLKLAAEALAGASLIQLARKYNIKNFQTVSKYIKHPLVAAIYGKIDLSHRYNKGK